MKKILVPVSLIFLFSLSFFLLSLSSLSFASIVSWEQQLDIKENGITEGKIFITTDKNSPIALEFSENLGELEVLDGTSYPISYYYLNNKLIFTPPLDRAEINFKSASFTSKEKNRWKFNMSIKSSEQIEKFSAKASLPKSEILSTNARVSADNGIELIWEQEGIPANRLLNIHAQYEQKEETQTAWLALGIGLLALIAAAFLWLYENKMKNKHYKTGMENAKEDEEGKEDKEADKTIGDELYKPELYRPESYKSESYKPESLRLLEPEEQQILGEIARMGGKCTQRHLQTFTNLPKATLSRRIQKLERKELIERIQKGNMNVIVLK